MSNFQYLKNFYLEKYLGWRLGGGVFALTLLWLLKNDLQLATDGVEHLRLTLVNETIFAVSDRRAHAYWLTQWPVQILLKLGCEDFDVLKKAYGFGVFSLFLMPVVFFIIPGGHSKNREKLLPLYFIAVGGVAYSSVYLIGTEHQTILPLAFLISCILVNYRKNTAFVNIFGIILLMILTRTYETSVAPFIIFLLFSIYSFVKNFNKNTQKVFLFVIVVICIFGVSNAVIGIFSPRDAGHRDGFLQHLGQSIKNPVFITFLICVGAVLVKRVHGVLCAVLLVFASLYQIYCWFHSGLYQDVAQLSFASRTLTIFIVPAIIGLVFFWSNLPNIEGAGNFSLVVLGVAVILLSNPFLDFKNRLQYVAKNNSSFVDSGVHLLADHAASWRWTFPSLSMAWQPQCVKAILLNADSKLWQPYDPKNELGFGKFVTYADNLYPKKNFIKICHLSKNINSN